MTEEQSYTPKGRARTCPWISLRGKEWNALKDIRDSLSALVVIQTSIAQSQQDIVELERQKIELSMRA